MTAFEALAAEVGGDELGDLAIVLDDEDASRGRAGFLGFDSHEGKYTPRPPVLSIRSR
jgi:hypothetical protein